MLGMASPGFEARPLSHGGGPEGRTKCKRLDAHPAKVSGCPDGADIFRGDENKAIRYGPREARRVFQASKGSVHSVL